MYTLLKVIAEAITKLKPNIRKKLSNILDKSPCTTDISSEEAFARIRILEQILKELETSYLAPDNEYPDTADQDAQDSANVDLESDVLRKIYRWMYTFIQRLELTEKLDGVTRKILVSSKWLLAQDITQEKGKYYWKALGYNLLLPQDNIDNALKQDDLMKDIIIADTVAATIYEYLEIKNNRDTTYEILSYALQKLDQDGKLGGRWNKQVELMHRLSPKCLKILCTMPPNLTPTQYELLLEVGDVYEELWPPLRYTTVQLKIASLLRSGNTRLDITNLKHIAIILERML